MNCTKKITLTGYTVRFTDRREPRPRTIHEDVYALDKDGVEALSLLGLDVADMIAAKYGRGGYHVVSVERISPRQTVTLDLSRIWAYAAAETQANCQALTNLEGNADA